MRGMLNRQTPERRKSHLPTNVIVPATSRELVYQTLECRSPERVPRQMWYVPWAENTYPEEFAALQRDFPPDIINIPPPLKEPSPLAKGDPYAVGRSVDDWGCVFENIEEGIIGGVRDPIVKDWDEDWKLVRLPSEWLALDRDAVNRACGEAETFMLPGVVARPFERLQFLAGPENLYMDLLDPPGGLLKFIERLRDFYCQLFETWARTDVDGLFFIDDWGSQGNLLVTPELWREMFKPIYRDLIGIAHAHGKKAFMHSDGNILQIYPGLVEMGLDAINSQIGCMGPENLKPFAGNITFWGEVDRQQVLCRGSLEDVDAAVTSIHKHLWKNGGCIAQCEFGPGAKPENVRRVFERWDELARG